MTNGPSLVSSERKMLGVLLLPVRPSVLESSNVSEMMATWLPGPNEFGHASAKRLDCDRGQTREVGLDAALKIEVVIHLVNRGIVREAVEEVERAEAGFHLVGRYYRRRHVGGHLVFGWHGLRVCARECQHANKRGGEKVLFECGFHNLFFRFLVRREFRQNKQRRMFEKPDARHPTDLTDGLIGHDDIAVGCNQSPSWVIFDGSNRFGLPVDFRMAPKADLRQ